jgi:DNA-binding transcriptional MerR regulator
MDQIVEWFTTSEAKRITGFDSVMMLHYLKNEGIVRPTKLGKRGRGRTCRYSYGDLVVLKAVKRILDAGITTTKLKRAIQHFQKQYKNKSVNDEVNKSFAVIDDRVIFFDDKHAVDLTAEGQLTFVFDGLDMMVADIDSKAIKISALDRRRKKIPVHRSAKTA